MFLFLIIREIFYRDIEKIFQNSYFMKVFTGNVAPSARVRGLFGLFMQSFLF